MLQRLKDLGKWWYLIPALLVLAYPLKANSYWIDVGFFFGLYILLGLSLNIIVGHAGLYNLGHAAFYAIGAYVTAILNTQFGIPIFWLLPVSALVAAAVAFVIVRPILHLRGDYLLIVTLGFSEIVRIALINDPLGLTGGPNGVFGIARPYLFGFKLSQPNHFYYLIWLLVIIVILAQRRLDNSRIGRAWNYIREDELAAEAMGIDTTGVKLLGFVVGAALAGVAGNVYAAKMMIISPDSFTIWESVIMFAIVILGGAGSIPGVIIGTFGMVVLPEIFREFAEYRMLIFGGAMIIMMIFRPQGLWPSQRMRRAMEDDEVELPEPEQSAVSI
ncbi:branched-chain amino acid ABC transporter permease [Metallumcola ferriviriculae]|uniref:Branched-chain amino acid ABC transporter permease n=1 Tax=Metallumcola ferriviriculae TaxID=3039180 RepID=A0AAU0ULD9_9FIRM|nr:branched-chain amino acid ABC transporter permease [Desulfitibacteraceae bacterium MK1]